MIKIQAFVIHAKLVKDQTITKMDVSLNQFVMMVHHTSKLNAEFAEGATEAPSKIQAVTDVFVPEEEPMWITNAPAQLHPLVSTTMTDLDNANAQPAQGKTKIQTDVSANLVLFKAKLDHQQDALLLLHAQEDKLTLMEYANAQVINCSINRPNNATAQEIIGNIILILNSANAQLALVLTMIHSVEIVSAQVVRSTTMALQDANLNANLGKLTTPLLVNAKWTAHLVKYIAL